MWHSGKNLNANNSEFLKIGHKDIPQKCMINIFFDRKFSQQVTRSIDITNKMFKLIQGNVL